MRLIYTLMLAVLVFPLLIESAEAKPRWERCESIYYDLVPIKKRGRVLWRVRQHCDNDFKPFAMPVRGHDDSFNANTPGGGGTPPNSGGNKPNDNNGGNEVPQ